MEQIPSGIFTYIGRKICYKISQLLFRDAYEISDNDYWNNMSIYPSRSLNSHILFDLHLPYKKYIHNNECNSIIIKTKNEKALYKVHLTVTAYSNFCTHQEFLTFYHVDDTPTIAKLPNIPLREIEVKNNCIISSFKKLKIKAEEIYTKIDDPTNIANQYDEHITYPMFSTL